MISRKLRNAFRALSASVPLCLASAHAALPTPSADGLAIAAKFGALNQVQQISLSPDGKHIAVVTPIGGGGSLLIIDVDAGTMRGIMKRPSNQQLLSCGWSSASRLYCRIRLTFDNTGQLLGYTRMIAVNVDGSGVTSLSAQDQEGALSIIQNGGVIIDKATDGKSGMVLMTRQIPQVSATGNIANSAKSPGYAVEQVDTVSLKRFVVEPANEEAEEYISDGYGTVRIMGLQPVSSASGYAQTSYRYFYRLPNSRSWKPLTTIDTSKGAYSAGFEPEIVDGKANLAYGLDLHDGFKALYSMALDGSNKEQLVAAHPNVDVDGFITVGPHNRLVGVSYASEHRLVDYFDPEISHLNATLTNALPGNPQVGIWDTSDDEKQMLLVATSDTDPGAFYLFDKTNRHLAPVLPIRPELDGMKMGSMQAITFPASDGSKIPAYLTLPPGSSGKNLPAIVMPHGGPEARDEWGFDWLVQFFVARGFAVLQPEFRGSTGYGSAWFNKNGFKSWATAIGDVNDAGRWLQTQGIAAPGKLAIFGWSYGGYAALQSAVVDPDLFKAVVAVAPVTDFDKLREERRGFMDYAAEDVRIGNGPHVAAGSPARHAERFKAPVLLFHGDKDQNVGIGESILMRDRLLAAGKSVDLVEFPGLDHQLYDVAARTKMLSTSDAFIRQALGIAP